jgi:hypothetical protein
MCSTRGSSSTAGETGHVWRTSSPKPPKGYTSDADRARAIWEFLRRQRFPRLHLGRECNDVLKVLNVYGYTLCGNEAHLINDLWKAAGLTPRRGYPVGHVVSEVFYDGDYHLLDSDEHVICLERDNKTIASCTEVVRDHDLIKRTHTYGIGRRDRSQDRRVLRLALQLRRRAEGRPGRQHEALHGPDPAAGRIDRTPLGSRGQGILCGHHRSHGAPQRRRPGKPRPPGEQRPTTTSATAGCATSRTWRPLRQSVADPAMQRTPFSTTTATAVIKPLDPTVPPQTSPGSSPAPMCSWEVATAVVQLG